MKKIIFSVLSAITILFVTLSPGVTAVASSVYKDKVVLNYNYYKNRTAPMDVTSKGVLASVAKDNPHLGYVRINVEKTGGQAVYWILKDEAGNTVEQGFLFHKGDLVRLTYNVRPNQIYRLNVGCHTGPSCSAKGQISTLTHVNE